MSEHPVDPENEIAEEIWAEQALTSEGWRSCVRVGVTRSGTIGRVDSGVDRGSLPHPTLAVEALLPAPANLHSHAFQRGMAGLSERRLAGEHDSFWTWREVMYHFVDRLSPEEVEAIAALVYVEMLEAGYAAVGEFHYLHHRLGGAAYDDPAEMSHRIFAAARETGIGLTHLPVLYSRGGLSGEPLEGGQLRFGCDAGRFETLWHSAERALREMPSDSRLGVAPHSLRAVNREELRFATELAPGEPLHIHVAEQVAEVEAVESAYGRRPVAWLLDEFEVDPRWCLIHATQMTPDETERLAATGAVAGLCPITESNLGDGIFDGRRFLSARGRFGVGSDSNVRIQLTEELRTLEYSQRLRDRERAVLVGVDRSVGRALFSEVCRGGAQALGREGGEIRVGAVADLLSLRSDDLALGGLRGDTLLDAWIFATGDRLVEHVWSAGRRMVDNGVHRARGAVVHRASAVLSRLRSEL